MSEIELLRQKLEGLKLPYELANMVEVTSKMNVSGKAFFPVGRGLWKEEDEKLLGKTVMILGQDFDNEDNIKPVLERGGEDVKINSTWRNLRAVLKKVEIPLDQCFFTNAVMGVRKENFKNTGPSSGFKNKDFLTGCRKFFIEQIKAQRPSLILVLGWYPVVFLNDISISTALSQKWSTSKSITQVLADEDLSVVQNVQFEGIANFSTTIVVLFHPSLRGVNVAKLSKQEAANFNVNTEVNRIQSVYSLP